MHDDQVHRIVVHCMGDQVVAHDRNGKVCLKVTTTRIHAIDLVGNFKFSFRLFNQIGFNFDIGQLTIILLTMNPFNPAANRLISKYSGSP